MRLHFDRSSLLAMSMCLAAMLPSVAAAQEADDVKANHSASEEIIVTAQRRAQNLQDVPVAVSTITSSSLERTGVSSTDQLLAVSPGLSFTRQLSGATPYIRGVGTQSVSAGNEAAVAMYVDGVYYQSPYANVFSFNNVEQVEVLRGPQGTLYGRNATGGLISVRTRDPQSELTMKASVSYANYDTVEASGYVSGGSDTIAMDLAVQRTHQGDGYGRNILTGEDVNFRREWGIRSKVMFTPTDDLKIVLAGDYSRFESDLGIILSQVPNVTPGKTFYDSEANLPQSNTTDWYGGSLTIDYDFGGASLKSTTAYRKLDVAIRFDQDGTPVAFADIYLDQKDKSFQQELLLQGELGAINYTLGAFYFDGTGAYSPLGVRSAVSAPNNFDLYSPLSVKSISGFAQTDIKLGDATTLTTGLRYTSDKRANTPTIAFPGGDPENPAQIVAAFPTQSKTFSKLTWRLALAHEITDDIMVFASYNRGFKSGVYSTSAPNAPPVEPEVLDAFEGGLRSEFLDRSLRFNVTGYYYKYKNIQLNSIVEGASLITNAAKGTSYGLEIETNYVANMGDSKLTLSANTAINRTRYDEFPNGTVFTPVASGFNSRTTGVDLSGNEFVRSPKWTYNLAADFSTPVGDSTEFAISANLFHSDRFFWEQNNRSTQPSVDLVNAQASLAFEDGKFRVRVFGKNLTNKKYFSYYTESTLGDKAGPADPRTYGIAFDVQF